MDTPCRISPEASEGAFGRLQTDARSYRPLDTINVSVQGRSRGDEECTVRLCDPLQRVLGEQCIRLTDNTGHAEFQAGGPLGTHYVYLFWPGQDRHSRYVNVRLDGETSIESGDADVDGLYPFTREAMLLGRREYATPAGKFVGYVSADTWHFDGIWLRDWIYGLPAYQYWERDMACGLDRFLENQADNGMIPDGIERDGRTWRVGLESDVEYIMTLAVWRTWQATGDDAWMAAALPRLEKALAYIRSDPKHWDATHRLVKRQHSCDTWDFDMDGASDKGEGRHVVATCDQSGYAQAFRAMAAMHRHLGAEQDASRWDEEAESYRQRAKTLLWDGTKFQHHVHLDPMDHDGFDERHQLAMGNTWAMTRGLAEPDQARSIIDEYQRRHAETGDAYPWWSLQPGYPDSLGYFGKAYCRQGGYANGGLMPWVGGELCRAAFWFGREHYGVKLLRQYADHLRRTGGAQVWYWPDGTPGFRTTNEVPYASWGMAEWIAALTEGLAGIRPQTANMQQVLVAPCWAAARVDSARVMVRYAASKAYFAYRMSHNRADRSIAFEYSGSGQAAQFRALLPTDLKPARVAHNGVEIEWYQETVEDSRYLCCTVPIQGPGRLTIS